MTADIPALDLGEMGSCSVCPVYVENRKIEGHPYEDAKHAISGDTAHKRLVGGILDLAARVKY